ncbi:MAG TPA: hypothetical protein GX724_00120 [Fibrobacter sp.]|nr:hypothetical protein [Fibrobacter sp.]
MNFRFSIFLKIATLMSFVSLTLIGCSSTTPADPDENNSSSSIAPPLSSVAPTKTSPVKINEFGVTQVGADRFNLVGNIMIDYTDTTVQNVDSVKIDNIVLNVGLVQENSLGDVGAKVIIQLPPTYPTERVINLNEIGAYIDLNSFETCGDFVVEVIVYSKSDDGKNTYISKETAAFSKPAAVYCPEPVSSSSSQEILIEMDSYEITLGTSKVSGNVAIDFETGTLFPASQLSANKATIDAVLVWENGVGVMKSARSAGLDNYPVLAGGNDTKFAEELNSSSGEAPPPPIYTKDFSYLNPSMSMVEELAYGLYYAVQTSSYNPETKDGFFVFMVGRDETGTNGTSIKFTVYKKK